MNCDWPKSSGPNTHQNGPQRTRVSQALQYRQRLGMAGISTDSAHEKLSRVLEIQTDWTDSRSTQFPSSSDTILNQQIEEAMLTPCVSYGHLTEVRTL